VICFRPWTLEQTVEHYLNQSLQRDGYSRAKVSVKNHDGQVAATFSGVPDSYGTPLTTLLDTADLAYQGASKLNGDGKWAYNWYLFLPLGMALENRKSIELLHFPPDYSLTQAQDYLESATTDRWASLLTDNGIPATETPAFQTIIDIAPSPRRPMPARTWKRLRLLHRLPDAHGQGTEPARQRFIADGCVRRRCAAGSNNNTGNRSGAGPGTNQPASG
jgi:hypothetical protein